MDRKTSTIDLGKGIQYARVADRSAEFHKDNEQCSVETTCEFKDGYAMFSARVTTGKGTFTGHSMGKVNALKAFEKLETIAVGRALAFAGYLASGEIACAEEMADIVTDAQLNALKLKYSKEHNVRLDGMTRPEKQQAFRGWVRTVVGEDLDFSDRSNWTPEWLQRCWKELQGVDADVPFEE